MFKYFWSLFVARIIWFLGGFWMVIGVEGLECPCGCGDTHYLYFVSRNIRSEHKFYISKAIWHELDCLNELGRQKFMYASHK